MAKRKGLGKGKGKGYKNLQGRDPKVHSDSARGRKQPQKINIIPMNTRGKEKKTPSKEEIRDYMILHNEDEVGIGNEWNMEEAEYHLLLSDKYYYKNKGEPKDTDGDGVPDSKDCDPNNKYKQVLEKVFPVKKGVEIDAHWEKTRSGFRHIAILKVGGYEHERAKVTYLNRTWESFEFETVLRKLLDSSGILSTKEKEKFLEDAKTGNLKEIEEKFGAISSIAKLGNIMADTKEEKNKWKKRMLKAGIPELDFPKDWDTLDENEKEKRLDSIIKQMNKKIR